MIRSVLDIIGQFIADYFAAQTPLFELENPYPVLKEADNPNTPNGQPRLISVLLPIRAMKVSNNDAEMTLARISQCGKATGLVASGFALSKMS